MKVLTSKQVEFCNRYVANPENLTNCALGLWKNPSVAANRQLKKLEVQEYLKKLNDKIDKSNILSITQMQEMLTKIATGEIKEEVVKLDKKTGNQIVIEIPSSLQTRLKALETLGRSSGMFVDRIEAEIKTISINIDYGDED